MEKHPCHICKRTLPTVRGLSTHISQIHGNWLQVNATTSEYIGSRDTQQGKSLVLPIAGHSDPEFESHTAEQPELVDHFGTSSTITCSVQSIPYPKPAGSPSLGIHQVPVYARGREWQPWEPFISAAEYNLAHAFWKDSSTKSHIDYFLDYGLDGDLYSFRNVDDIRLRWRQRNYTYGLPSLFPTDKDYCMWNHKDLPNVGPIFYRDIVECIKLLLRHPAFMEHLILTPT